MPWKETCPVNQRVLFMAAVKAGEQTIAGLCRLYEVSPKTAYKWIARYDAGGPAALEDRSRAPKSSPQATSEEVTGLIVDVRKRHPTWGPRKIVSWIRARAPSVEIPAPSTCGALLKRLGLVSPRKRRKSAASVPAVGIRPPYAAPNAVWCADFKGDFRTKNGSRCYPLTISDGFSRLLIRVEAVLRPDYDHVWPVFEEAFREYGLPFSLRTDNGPPFATRAMHGLSRLAVRLLKLRIWPDRIEPGHPEQNGRHERMHRTLKNETARPPQRDLREQQAAFDRFREEYNCERPHEALHQRPPLSVYISSPRKYPRRLEPFAYPEHLRVFKVNCNGQIRWRTGAILQLGLALIGEYIGFEQVDDGTWNVMLGEHQIATLEEQLGSRMIPVPLVRPSWTEPTTVPTGGLPLRVQE